MRWLRRKLAAQALPTVLFFAAAIATPKSGLVAHSHAGGEHEHVHLDGGDNDANATEIDRLLADALGSDAHHHHHHHHAPPGEPAGIENPDTPATWHWHAQSPFHRAVTAAGFSLAMTALAVAAPASAPVAPPAVAAGSSRARAPPISL